MRPIPNPRPPSFSRNVGVLAICQALFFMANTVVVSTSGLVGLQLAPSPLLSTLPLGVQFVGTMAATMPASLLMRRIGRRHGLMLGTLLGVVAGIVGWHGVMQGSFLLFCIGGVLYGAFGAFCQYYRFTAADAADAALRPDPAAARARAIALVMAGGVVAAVLGPELAKRTQHLFDPVLFAGCYAAVAVLAALATLVLGLLHLPHDRRVGTVDHGRPLGQILRQPKFVTALLAAIVGYVTMNLLMTATPLAMIACGHDFADSAFVIQWHVLGMFVPSFFSGSLIARFGPERIIGAGATLNLVCIAVALSGLDVARFAVALGILGVGWNFMFIGGTTLLTECYEPAEKARIQGMNDLLMFTSVGISATFAGLLHEVLGWHLLNLVAVPALLLVLAVLARRRLSAPAAA